MVRSRRKQKKKTITCGLYRDPIQPNSCKGQVEDNQRNLYMNWALDSINTLLLMLLSAEGIAVMISNAIINLNMVD